VNSARVLVAADRLIDTAQRAWPRAAQTSPEPPRRVAKLGANPEEPLAASVPIEGLAESGTSDQALLALCSNSLPADPVHEFDAGGVENCTTTSGRLRRRGSLDAALEEIMKTPPTTPASARAFIEHVVEWDKDGVLEANGRYLATLLRSPLLAP
jgi:hypothetical protein